jgi:hypothetical protein
MSDDVSAGTVAFDAALQAANRWLARDPHVAARTHTTLRLQDVSGVIDGPSLGLAIAALCVTHTMSQLAMRNQFRIPQNVALTGALDSDGRVHSVDGIPEKITRAFFSPVEYVAVPAGLEKEAAHVIGKLNARYPLRALGVIPLRNLDDLFSQRRLVSDYTVPLPLHIAHQAGRMPRWALTSALIVVLFFVAMSSMWYYYPLTRFWLDKAPVHWDASNGTELIVFNNDMIELWRFRPDLGGVPVEWPALGRDTVENPEGRWFAPMVKGKSAGYKASYSMCKIGDTNGDGVPELFFVPTNRVESLQPSINRTTPVYCLDANGQVLWTHNYDSLDVSPLAPLGTRAIEVRSWNLVDWNNSGKANIVLALVDRHGENPALIEELDGETGKSLARFWHKQWFWDLSVLPRTDDHGIQLWAGTLSQSGYPELYIFRDSLRSRVCPYNDTSGVTLARYPVADVFNNLNKGAWLIAINGRVNAATLHFSNTEIRTPLGNRWRGYNFNIDHSLRWDKHRVPNAWWGEVEQFARAGIIAEPSSPEAWLEPLTYCEIWTGNGWVPADSSRPRPNPPPIFERWNH